MLHKPEKTEVELTLRHVGFSIGKEFVIGEGLDYEGLFRGWRGIYQVLL
jgi:hypoxanthine-guanine phosphoribosyltransferase